MPNDPAYKQANRERKIKKKKKAGKATEESLRKKTLIKWVMLTIREKPNRFLRKTTHSVAGADHDEKKKKKQETKDNKFLKK